jgi:tetratricopeptide (TPR) repeat protein
VLIARDEEDQVRDCLASFWPHVDQVVLCDTGSEDRTIARARRFARERGEKNKLVIGHFDWIDDFAAARNHADSLATGRVLITVDLDDRIEGAENLRTAARRLLDAEERISMAYVYIAQTVASIGYDRRVYLARAHRTHWERRTWEHRLDDWDAGSTACRPSGVRKYVLDIAPWWMRWVHQRDSYRGHTRDARILKAWAKEEPEEPEIWLHLVEAHQQCGEHEQALAAAERLLAFDDVHAAARAVAHRYAGASLQLLGRGAEAKPHLLEYLRVEECSCGIWLQLALIASELEEWEEALSWARLVLSPNARLEGGPMLAPDEHGRVRWGTDTVLNPKELREFSLQGAEYIGGIAAEALGVRAPRRSPMLAFDERLAREREQQALSSFFTEAAA